MAEEMAKETLVDEEVGDAPVNPEEKDTAPEKEPKKKVRKLEAALLEQEKKIEELTAALATQNDTYLRLAAEYDNFRRRSQKEREGTYAEAYAEALSALFPVVDNLERAAMYTDGENVAKGVQMTLSAVKNTFEKLGVEEIDPTGESFDPNLHNAVMHVEDESLGEGVVVEVLQKGYRRGERILRYAMVKVAN